MRANRSIPAAPVVPALISPFDTEIDVSERSLRHSAPGTRVRGLPEDARAHRVTRPAYAEKEHVTVEGARRKCGIDIAPVHQQPVGEVCRAIDLDDEQRAHLGMCRRPGHQQHALGLLGIRHDCIKPDLGPIGDPRRRRARSLVGGAGGIGRPSPRPSPPSSHDRQIRQVPKEGRGSGTAGG